jgi:hypothetical protein
MGDMVIVAYRPKPGGAEALLALTKTHVPRLRALGFATARPALAMTDKDGVVIEVFEWAMGAIDKAHHHPEVQKMWGEYGACCDYIPLIDLPETTKLFAQFTPIDL